MLGSWWRTSWTFLGVYPHLLLSAGRELVNVAICYCRLEWHWCKKWIDATWNNDWKRWEVFIALGFPISNALWTLKQLAGQKSNKLWRRTIAFLLAIKVCKHECMCYLDWTLGLFSQYVSCYLGMFIKKIMWQIFSLF